MPSASRTFLVLSGAYLLLVGVVGFAVNGAFPTSPGAVGADKGHIFGLLETNGWHNAAALGLAVPSLIVAARLPRWAPEVALLSGALNVVVFTAFAVWGGAAFLVASNDADQVVHALTAVGGIACGARDLLSRSGPRSVSSASGFPT